MFFYKLQIASLYINGVCLYNKRRTNPNPIFTDTFYCHSWQSLDSAVSGKNNDAIQT